MKLHDASAWPLDPSITFLNHGSFGCCPREVLAVQQSLRDRLEERPVEFLARELEARYDLVREDLGDFLGARASELVFVPNATYAVNSVLRSFPFDKGDELLVTDHAYNACHNVLEFVAARSGCQVVVAELPWPIDSSGEVLEALLDRVSSSTRLLLIDHVTSPTALVLPVERIVPAMQELGVRVLVDGAHAPGHLNLDLHALGADYYTGNCHKWINAPKGSAFLWVPERWQSEVRPACISHGANSPRDDRSRYLIEFDWTGTSDPTAILTIPAAIQIVEEQIEGGWPGLRAHNRELVMQARRVLLDRLQMNSPAPEEMLGAMASIALPTLNTPALDNWDPLQSALREQYRIEVPVFGWGGRGGMRRHRCLRISAQYYNQAEDYARLAEALYSLGVSSAPV
ncbi:MAG: aminotransferase class V-fold PLP-dependent enzyme [Planctomycetes bacterium]|nr:aminotransferase class V-fold PLP-dependent enzyme [Planctomycetota bacterium]